MNFPFLSWSNFWLPTLLYVHFRFWLIVPFTLICYGFLFLCHFLHNSNCSQSTILVSSVYLLVGFCLSILCVRLKASTLLHYGHLLRLLFNVCFRCYRYYWWGCAGASLFVKLFGFLCCGIVIFQEIIGAKYNKCIMTCIPLIASKAHLWFLIQRFTELYD